MNERAMCGGGETALSGEYLQQLRACRANGDLLTLSENIRNLLREILVHFVASARRRDKKAKSNDGQQNPGEIFHSVRDANAPDERRAEKTRP